MGSMPILSKKVREKGRFEGTQFCQLKFALKRDMYDHVKFVYSNEQHTYNVHEGIKPHQCSHCSAKFAFKASLKRHLIISPNGKSNFMNTN